MSALIQHEQRALLSLTTLRYEKVVLYLIIDWRNLI